VTETLDRITRWLVAPTTVAGPEQVFGELADRLCAAGLELQRASASLMTKHPDVFGRQLIWTRGEGAHSLLRSHEVIASAAYQASPVAFVRRERRPLRARLDGPAEDLGYAVMRELKAAGLTDYFITPMPFRSGVVSFVSWATDRPGGFRDEELALLQGIVPALSLRWELASATYALESLLSTYLGDNAAARVLGGEFKRRTGSRIRAVIWATDLRGFTTMVDEQPIDDALSTLDEYFSCVAAPVARHGGEVLKYVGDAVLAVFPIGDESPREVGARALRALDDALATQAEVNADRAARGETPIRFGLALHVGEVVYGNIGVAGRLDFTVVGRAVNEVCRVEEATKEIGTPVLLTETFVELVEADHVAFVSEQVLPGVRASIRLYTLDPARRAVG